MINNDRLNSMIAAIGAGVDKNKWSGNLKPELSYNFTLSNKGAASGKIAEILK